MIQKVRPEFANRASTSQTLPLYKREKSRSLKVDFPAVLPPVYAYNCVGPAFPTNASFVSPSPSFHEKYNGEHCVAVFTYSRWSCQAQLVPAFGGLWIYVTVSATGIKPNQKSTINYFPPINLPFTDNAVTVELLKKSEEATREVGQELALNTFDLGGVMKAMRIIWKSPAIHNKHVETPGSFNTAKLMNYLRMLTGHKYSGSGYAEILIQTDLQTSGYLSGILK